MLNELYEAQSNDAYWHGLFGGLYLPHLRRAIYKSIVAMEAMLDAVEPRPAKESMDLDMDGQDEVFLHNSELQAVVRMDGSAAICELDAYRLRHNFGDTLMRQTEHYHRKVNAGNAHEHGGGGIANPHERVSFKHVISAEDLATDIHPKSLFIDKWQGAGAEKSLLPLCYEPAGGRGAALSFKGTAGKFAAHKKISLNDARLAVDYEFDAGAHGRFSVEINLAMPSCDGPAGRLKVGDEIIGGFGQPQQIDAMKEIWLEDEVLGGKLRLSSSQTADFHSWPHFSVSQSEAGFEKIMQALTIVLSWDLSQLKGPLKITIEVY